MNTFDRRQLLTSAAGAGASVTLGRWLAQTVTAADAPKQPIKIGQIGTGHERASGKISTLRKLSDYYEVVGIVESDPELRKKHENHPTYRGLTWMTEEQLLNTQGLQAVAVEVDSDDDHLMDIAERCISAGMHIHLDKPGGESFSKFKQVLDEAGRRNQDKPKEPQPFHRKVSVPCLKSTGGDSSTIRERRRLAWLVASQF